MISIQAILNQILGVIQGLAGFSFFGLYILPLLKGKSGLAKLSLTSSAGYLATLTITYLSSYFFSDIWPHIAILSLILISFNIFATLKYHNFNNFEIRNNFKSLKNKLGGSIASTQIIYFLISALAPVLIPIVYFAKKNYLIPTFTQGNNDLAQFVLEAKAISLGGFHGIDFITNQNQFIFARDNDFGAPNFLLWMSKFLSNDPWKAVTPSLSLVTVLLFIAVTESVRARFSFSLSRSMQIALVSSSGAVTLYLNSNVFLSQMICMWLWANTILLIVSNIKSEKPLDEFKLLALIGLNLSASFYTYPHMALIGFGTWIASLIVVKMFRNNRKSSVLDNLSMIKIIGIPVLITALTCNLYLKAGINLFIYRASATNGWPMPNGFSIANLILVGDYYGRLQRIFEIFSAVLIFLIAIKFLKEFRSRKIEQLESLMNLVWIIVPLCLYIALAGWYGYSSYKAWKTIFSFAPFILSGFAARILMRKRVIPNSFVISILVISIIVPVLRQSVPLIQNKELFKNRVSSQDLYNLQSDLSKYKISEINIELTPFFETMYAGAIIDISRITFTVPTYAPVSVNKTTCTLVRNDNIAQRKLEPNLIKKINDTYSIIRLPSDCI